MTYGLYSDDLKFVKFGDTSLEDAKKYLRKGTVVCSEKEITTGLKIILHFHSWRKPCHFHWEEKYELGFVSVEWMKTSYKWADKIVETFKEGNRNG